MTDERAQDTPEVDAEEFQREGSAQWLVKASFARKLERERNEAMKDAARYRWAMEHFDDFLTIIANNLAHEIQDAIDEQLAKAKP